VVNQVQFAARAEHFLQQRRDELAQVVHLLQLAPAVLVEAAVTRQDVQLLEQLG
jgi:hypothetical protein